jgi:hypothetical protein
MRRRAGVLQNNKKMLSWMTHGQDRPLLIEELE